MQDERYLTVLLAVCAGGVLALGFAILTKPSDAMFGDRRDPSYEIIEVEIDGEVFEAIVRQEKRTQTEGDAAVKADAGANFY